MRDVYESLPRLASKPLLLGRYQLHGRAGLGGMSEVFLATEHVRGQPTRHVAIKALRSSVPGGLTVGAAAVMFAREGHTLLSLGHHPNVCQGYELCAVGGHDLIVMEWIDGLSLRALVTALEARNERLSYGEAAGLVAQAAAGLEHAHRARRADGVALELVHLDVSPTNLMLRFDGLLKLIDFGVARTACDQQCPTDGKVVGKFGYMAPEQLRGDTVDSRTDVFALGVCLFELLTGRRLYQRGDLREICEAVWREPVPSARAVDPALPPELDDIVQRALQKVPAQRFPSADAMLAALEAYMVQAGAPTGARPIAQLLERVVPLKARAWRLTPSPTIDVLFDQDARQYTFLRSRNDREDDDTSVVTVSLRDTSPPSSVTAPAASGAREPAPPRGSGGMRHAFFAFALVLAGVGVLQWGPAQRAPAVKSAPATAAAPREPSLPMLRARIPATAPPAPIAPPQETGDYDVPAEARLPVPSAAASVEGRRSSHGFVLNPGF
jgi:eukaryotic-like serine/threonine-protein kinase